MITFNEVQLGEKLHAGEVRGQISHVRNGVAVRNCCGVETSVIAAGTPGSVLLLNAVKGRGPRARGSPDYTHGLQGVKLCLHISRFVRVQLASLCKNWGSRGCNVVEDAV